MNIIKAKDTLLKTYGVLTTLVAQFDCNSVMYNIGKCILKDIEDIMLYLKD